MNTRARNSRWRAHAVALAPALIAALFVYRNAPPTFFAQDDITFLSRAAGLEPASAFRWLSETALFRVEFLLFGLHPLGYHLVNLALHLLNVAGVYFLALRLRLDRSAAAAAALLFGVSAIAFTPLHWASGVVVVLMGTLLLAATLTHLAGRLLGRTAWLWAAAALAFLAMLCKEAAAVWLVAMAWIEWRSGLFRPRLKALIPAATATAAFALWFLASGQAQRFAGSEAYAHTASPVVMAQNLMTYLRWSVAWQDPIPDAIAAIDPGAWRVGLPVLLVMAIGIWAWRRSRRRPFDVGVAWLVTFLLPMLPLAHHTYLYYLYVPWIGGAVAMAAAGRRLLAHLPPRPAAWAAAAALSIFFVFGSAGVAARERLTQDYLPVDRTLRDATLLSHALAGLRAARLPDGARVAFVNPVPRRRFDLMTGAPTKAEDAERRRSYMPLEAAMRGGETLRLFLPKLRYLGFTTTIPAGWEDAECFLYEQRGWLKHWGRGEAALVRQAEFQTESRQWTAADSTWRRVRALRAGGEAAAPAAP